MSLTRNISANFGGNLWAGAMALVFIPLYIRFMGIEAYGLVGFFLTMQAVLSLLDAGLAVTLNREFARLSIGEGSTPQMRKLLRTFETIYWSVAVAGGTIIMLLARWIAVRWVEPEKLPISDVQQAIMIMGFAFTVQWPLALYSGGMQGLQKQVSLNAINATMATIRGLGAVLILWLVAPTVQAFFIWQVTAGLLHTAAIGIALWRSLGGTAGAEFSRTLLRSVWHFAAGMTVISVLSSILTQIDKIVVSGALSLEAFGYYAFAGTVAASLYRIVTPIYTAIFPRFSQLVARDAPQELATLYHKSSQALTVVIAPAAIFVALFANEVLLLWTRDAATAAKTHGILSVLILGTAVNGLLSIPYATLLAYGWTRVVVIMNVIAVLILIPGVFHLATRFGPRGAASAWLGYNLAVSVVLPTLVHTRLLRGELARWYLRDVGAPLVVAAVIGLACRYLVPMGSGDAISLLVRLVPVALLMQIAATMMIPDIRRRLRVWSPA